MGVFDKILGGGMKEAGEGIKSAGEGVQTAISSVGGLFNDIRTAITGVDAKSKARIEELLAAAEAKVADLAGQFQQIMGQVMLADAQSASWFNSGWRPAIGWVCAFALALYYPTRIITGMTIWVIQCSQAMKAFTPSITSQYLVLPPMPEVGVGDILGLVASLLGNSWLRTIEKSRGVASK